MTTEFFSFDISKEFDCPIERLYSAWSDLGTKAQWFKGPHGWIETERTLELKTGGTETMKGVFGDDFTTEYTAHFYDVRRMERIGFSFDVRLQGEIYSISTVVVEFKVTATGCMMEYHEQLALFSGQPVDEARSGRISGTKEHFDRLARLLAN